MKNKLFNGEEITKENVLNIMKKVYENNCSDDMTTEEKDIIYTVALQDYDGAEEDLEYLTEKLKEHFKANLQDVCYILSQGEWYYQNK